MFTCLVIYTHTHARAHAQCVLLHCQVIWCGFGFGVVVERLYAIIPLRRCMSGKRDFPTAIYRIIIRYRVCRRYKLCFRRCDLHRDLTRTEAECNRHGSKAEWDNPCIFMDMVSFCYTREAILPRPPAYIFDTIHPISNRCSLSHAQGWA